MLAKLLKTIRRAGGDGCATQASGSTSLIQALPPFDFQFFSSIASSGREDGMSVITLHNGDRLYGYSDGGYYAGVFKEHAAEFAELNLRPEGYPAAFDALISYHHENAFPILKSQFLPRGGVVMDVGCRACHFIVKAAPLATRMICVDPTDVAERYFHLHRAANRISNCEFYKCAVGRERSMRTFYSGSPGESFSGIYESTYDATGAAVVSPGMHAQRYEIETTTIDELSRPLERLDLLIIQINGAEHEALLGAQDALQRLGPTVFVTYGQSPSIPYVDSAEQIHSLLSKLHYRRILRGNGDDVYARSP